VFNISVRQLSGSREHKSDYGCLWIYLDYQDHEYIIRTMNTMHDGAVWLSCSKLHTRLQSVVLSLKDIYIAVSCPKS